MTRLSLVPVWVGRASALVFAWVVVAVCGIAECQVIPTNDTLSARALPKDELPSDRRLGDLKTLNGYFPFEPPKSKEAWQARADELRRQILVSTGLWPMPKPTAMNPVVHGKVDRDGYTVERVFFESYPGHFVTGSLYRPTGREGKLPGVLCPYGHWNHGRFYRKSPREIRQEIEAGAEKFDVGGRYTLQARCVQLARMGCVVFHYDMEGVADSVQLRGVAHHLPPRPHMDTPKNWGFYSAQAELRLQSIMGLQTYNSLRALDFLCELPDVDPERIGVTGASGGGTQTFILCAIDDRPAVAVPAVMVSTAMQGGCTCENACLLRVGAGNVDFAALFAPKPLCLIGANDWTVEIATKGGPELRKLYAMLGADDKLLVSPHNQFGHNYNLVSREVMYQWMNQHLGLGLPSPVVEADFEPLSIEELTVWTDEHPAPPSGEDYERGLLRQLTAASDEQIRQLVPHDAASLAEFRRVVGGAWRTMVGRDLPNRDDVTFEPAGNALSIGEHQMQTGLLRLAEHGEELPTLVLTPTGEQARSTVLWLDPEGKSALLADGRPRPAVARLLDRGHRVVGVDLLYQGEFLADGQPLTQSRMNPYRNELKLASFTFGYNPTVFAERVRDVLTAAAYFGQDKGTAASKHDARSVDVVALNGAGRWAAVAKAIAGDAIGRLAIDTGGFRFEQVRGVDDPDFLPGAVKYLDLPGAMALAAPGSVWIADGENVTGSESPSGWDVVSAAYRAAGDEGKLSQYDGAAAGAEQAAIEWLLRGQ